MRLRHGCAEDLFLNYFDPKVLREASLKNKQNNLGEPPKREDGVGGKSNEKVLISILEFLKPREGSQFFKSN